MMEKEAIDIDVDLDETKDIGGQQQQQHQEQQEQQQNSVEWIPGGRLGPFTVAEQVLPGTSTVIQCFAFREHQRDLLRFDPPWGLVFSPQNQTESGFINFSIIKGTVDPANLPEVSCRTVASRGYEFQESGGGGAASDAYHHKQHSADSQTRHNYQRNQGRKGRIYAPESQKGIMNSSQLSFLLLVLSAGAYYFYSVHLVPKLAASRKSSTAAAANDYLNKNYTHRPKKRNKGGLGQSRKKKSDGKKQARATVAPQRSKGSGSRSSLLSNSKRKDERLSLDKTDVQNDADTDIDTTDDGDDIVGLNVARSDDSTSDISSLLSVHDIEGTAPLRPKPEHNPKTVEESPPVVTKDDGETTIENSAQATAETINDEEENTKTSTKELPTDSESIDSTERTSAITREKEENQRKKLEKTPTRIETIVTTQGEEIERKLVATDQKTRQAETDVIDATTKELVEGPTTEIVGTTPEQQNPEIVSLPESPSTIRIHEEQNLSTEESTPDIPKQEKEELSMDESIHSNHSVVVATADYATASKQNHKINALPELPSMPAKADPVPIAAAGSAPSVSSSSSTKQNNIIVLLIEGMTCGGCVKVVNRVLNSFDEIDSVNTDLKTCKSTLSCNVPRLNLLPILTALDDVGMQAYLQSQSVEPPSPDRGSSENDANASAPVPGTTPAKCPLAEQAMKQQTLGTIGAIGRPLLTSERAPFASSVQKPTSPLSLMDELRVGSTPLRRYQCSCGCDGCICSARQVHENDLGTDISLSELCNRLETTLGTTKLEETFRKTGGSLELRNKLEEVSFPCGCSDKE